MFTTKSSGRSEEAEDVKAQSLIQGFDAIRLVIAEQGRAGRQIATTARANYEEYGQTKSIIGPQMMVTFGEGLFFIMKETLEVLDKLKKSVEDSRRYDQGHIRSLQRVVAELEEALKNQRRSYRVTELALKLCDRELTKKGRKKSFSKILEEAQAMCDAEIEDELTVEGSNDQVNS